MTGMSLAKAIRNGWAQTGLAVVAVVLVLANPEGVVDWLFTILLRVVEFVEEKDVGSRLAELLSGRAG